MRLTGTVTVNSRGSTLNEGVFQPDYSWDRTHVFSVAVQQPLLAAACPTVLASLSSPTFILYNAGTVPADNKTLRFDLGVSFDPYTGLTGLSPVCTNQYRRRGDGVPVHGAGMLLSIQFEGNSVTSMPGLPMFQARAWQSSQADGVAPGSPLPASPFWQTCRNIQQVAPDPPTSLWESSVTWGAATVTPRFRDNGCLYGASGSGSASYTYRKLSGFKIEGFHEWSVVFDLDSNLGVCCPSDSVDQTAHARDLAMFEAMHAGLRGDPEEIAQRMRFGRACRGCG